jgi:DNA-binding MarR family transcriptional regulator
MSTELERQGFFAYRRSDAAVLRILARRPRPLGVLGSQLNVSRQVARQIVDGLDRRGYATARRDDSDQRRVQVELTPLGREYSLAIRATIDLLQRRVEGAVSRSDLDVAQRVLATVATWSTVVISDRP